MSETAAVRKKRLLHRSRYRGTRESDLLMGQFATRHLCALTAGQLDDFERLLDEADQDILAWVYGYHPIPARHDNQVMRLLCGYRVQA